MSTVNVQPLSRTITLTVDVEEAKETRAWLMRAYEADTANRRYFPAVLNDLFGAVSAVAESREYGGH